VKLSLADLLFYAVAVATLATAAYAVFTRNIVRAVFSLLGTFFGMAILYGMLSADFVAVVQVLVYVGGILVLLLFAVMLTANIESARLSSPAAGWSWGLLAAVATGIILLPLALEAPWLQRELDVAGPGTATIGRSLLGNMLLPFEAVSVVLLGVVIGAVVVARLRRGGQDGEVQR